MSSMLDVAGRCDAGPTRARVQRLLAVPYWGTQANIAAAAGLDPHTISHIVDGQFAVGEATARAIAAVDPQSLRRKAAFIPIQVARQRLRSLQAQGWPIEEIARLTGLEPRTLRAVRGETRRQVTRPVFDAIEKVYERIGDATGPSGRAAGWARKQGWLPGRFYDDDGRLRPEWIGDEFLASIDAGRAREEQRRRDGEAKVRARRDLREQKARERLEAIRLSLEGHGLNEIGARIGCDGAIIHRYRREVRLSFAVDGATGLVAPRPECRERAAWVRRVLAEYSASGADPFVTARRLGMMQTPKWDFD